MFSKTYQTDDSALSKYNGLAFEVVRKIDKPELGFDAEVLPMYVIKLENDVELAVFPDEIETQTPLDFMGGLVGIIDAPDTAETAFNVLQWHIQADVDSDGHLSLRVSHKDGTAVMTVDEDLEDYGVRLTTAGIERSYRESL